MHRYKSYFGFLIKITISLGLLWWIVKSGHLHFNRLWEGSYKSYLFIAFLAVFVSTLLSAFRWKRLLDTQSHHPLPYFECLKLTLVGFFFNFVMPSSVGGDAVKVYSLRSQRKDDIPLSRAIASVFVDRLLGLYGMLALAVVSFSLQWRMLKSIPVLQPIGLAVLGLFLGMSIFFMVAFSRQFRRSQFFYRLSQHSMGKIITRIYESIAVFGDNRVALVQCILLSVVIQFLSVIFFALTSWALGFNDFPLGLYFFVAPVGFIIMSIPISPGGIGVGQVAFYTLFNIYAGKETEAGSLGITYFQICTLLLGFVGFAINMLVPKMSPVKKQIET